MGRKKQDGRTPPVQFRFTSDTLAAIDATAKRLEEMTGTTASRADAMRYAIKVATQGVGIAYAGELGAGRGRYTESKSRGTIQIEGFFPADSLAFKVRGKSMIEELIADGDIVVVRPNDDPPHGARVLAWLNDTGVVLKCFDKRSRQLYSGSKASLWTHDLKEEDSLLGVLVGVIRKVKF